MGKKEIVVNALQERGIMRHKDIIALGVSHNTIKALLEAEDIVRIGRGLYALEPIYHESATMIEIAAKNQDIVFNLVSALVFHNIGTQMPYDVWFATTSSKRPKMEVSSVVTYSKPHIFQYGIEEHIIEGITIKVYSIARTVADCFKHRNKVGLEVALEALRNALITKKATVYEIGQAAKAIGVYKVMKPYMEATVFNIWG